MARHAHDFYRTPAWVTQALFREHPLAGLRVLEPCAGDGAIIRVIKEYWPEARVTAVEIREEGAYHLILRSGAEVVCADILAQPLFWFPDVDTIITNPPFRLAMPIVERCLEIANGRAEVWMLMRLAMLESQGRYDFWQRHPVSRLYVLSERPSFTEDGKTDATAYAWYGWLPGCRDQQIRVLRRQAT